VEEGEAVTVSAKETLAASTGPIFGMNLLIRILVKNEVAPVELSLVRVTEGGGSEGAGTERVSWQLATSPQRSSAAFRGRPRRIAPSAPGVPQPDGGSGPWSNSNSLVRADAKAVQEGERHAHAEEVAVDGPAVARSEGEAEGVER
jgi:hypothetical protein